MDLVWVEMQMKHNIFFLLFFMTVKCYDKMKKTAKKNDKLFVKATSANIHNVQFK